MFSMFEQIVNIFCKVSRDKTNAVPVKLLVILKGLEKSNLKCHIQGVFVFMIDQVWIKACKGANPR